MLSLALPVVGLASGIPPVVPGNHELSAAIELIAAGQFKAAGARIDAALKQQDLSPDARRAFEFQHERMQRMRLDFSLSADQVEAKVRKRIPDLTDAEFADWDAHGLFEHMDIDGQRLYFNRAPSNLFHLSAAATARQKGGTDFVTSGLPKEVNDNYIDFDRKVIAETRATGKTSVLPQRVRVTQTLTVDADAVPAGKMVRAWIPYPRSDKGQQQDIAFVSSRPAAHEIAPESARQRSVYLEQPAQAGKPTVFKIAYEVTLYAQYHAIDPTKVQPEKITPELAPYMAERAPHVVFTEPLRVFSKQVVGDATNPYEIARRIYAAVDEIPWAGAREYSTIPDISAYTLRAGHGDCGEQTLLLITLMRMNGIPARWQSGWTFTDGKYDNIHDWAEIYLAPYGWVPVDVTYGRLASDDPALKWFYLGGLDNYRIAFNDDFSRNFVPAKQHFRSDTVDSQRGEVEWDGGNLYYDKWDYHFDWKILSTKQG
ncbi:MAG TPA: transglutaminase domain-containing protein [Rhodanobacteraceae bacterium]|jgi:transglutaminase-like putative cysteine protease|nr:transglutaminase domain-containing protein [Rhodanobacteraceae bacterium]